MWAVSKNPYLSERSVVQANVFITLYELFFLRFLPQSFKVTVSDGAATLVNFTLQSKLLKESKGNLEIWSKDFDFDIAANMAQTKYFSNDDLQTEFKHLAKTYPSFTQYSTEYMTRQGKTLILFSMSGSGFDYNNVKPHILLIGGLNGDEPVGTEILLRLARHLTTGTVSQKQICLVALSVFIYHSILDFIKLFTQ